ncbi:MAG: hypothetical protein VW450_08815, partial [Chloroflexota bacterium]
FAGYGEQVADPARDQIEYVDEDPAVRKYFEEQLAKRGLKTLMPADCYTNRNYVWDYTGVKNT